MCSIELELPMLVVTWRSTCCLHWLKSLIFQSSVSFQVDVSTAKAICFQNYYVENFIVWEHSGYVTYLQHLFVNYRNLMISTQHLCTSTTQDPLLVSFQSPIHFGNYTQLTYKGHELEIHMWFVSLLSPCYFGKNNRLIDAVILFQNKAWLWLRS